MVLVSSVLLRHAINIRQKIGPGLRLMAIGLVFFDLNAFNWLPYDKIAQDKAGSDEYQTLLSLRGVVGFLKAQPQPFRVHIFRDPKPNIADSFGIPSIEGASATLGNNFVRVMTDFDLLNVRFFIKPSGAADQGPVYLDQYWKVYENPNAFPRAWLVHYFKLEPNDDQLYNDINDSKINLRQTVLLSSKPSQALPATSSTASENVSVQAFSSNAIKLGVHAGAPASLVLSEMYWPEWRATVNGRETLIARADGAFRAVMVPAGDSVVEFRYVPWSFYCGAF